MRIRFRAGFKYQLVEPVEVQTDIRPPTDVETDFVSIGRDGLLRLHLGFAWDGASGGAIDTKTILPGSAAHDGVYRLLRWKLLEPEWRAPADTLLRRICLEDGMWAPRAEWVYDAVRLGGGPSANPAREKLILEAP